jgi:hypothetical protein
MKWHDMSWPAYGPPLSEDNLKDIQNIPGDAKAYRIEVESVSDPGSVIEVRDLFRRLYGEPRIQVKPNPYIAIFKRLKANVVVITENCADNQIVGTIIYRYWPSLNLGYIESVRVSANMRRRRLGIKLVMYALSDMRGLGINRIYSFAVSPEGARLLESARFTSESPDDPGRPWRKWYFTS